MPNAELTNADFPDIQGLVINGYGHLICTRYCSLSRSKTHTGEGLAARTPAGNPQRRATRSWHPKPECSLNIGFTCHGLQMLGLQNETIGSFATCEFSEGMAGGERPRVPGRYR